MTYQVCVGVDGTAAAEAALRLVVEDAALHGGEVLVLTAWSSPDALPGTADAEAIVHRQTATKIQDTAIERVLEGVSDPPRIERAVVLGSAREELVRRSRRADRLVVGTEHKGILKRIVDGSVSRYCVRHAQIPVIVVPHIAPGLADLGAPEALEES